MLYYPEELRICVLGHTLWKFWRWRIKRLSVNTRLAIRCAVASRAHRFVSIYSGLQSVFVERDGIRFARRVAGNGSMKNCWQTLLGYFGSEELASGRCGHCDRCAPGKFA